jgi:spiro-SPASM protein
MKVDTFAALVGKIARFCGDAVIDISLWGEPSLHPEILEIIRTALAVPGLDLVIETSGVGWDPEVLARVKAQIPRAPTWILSLDAASESVYRALRGEGFAESRRTADSLLSLFPGSVHVQAVRMKENEEDLEGFYAAWKKRTGNVIIQKYDDFSKFLPDRKVADLSPLRRLPCWHLKRDFPVLIDGTVPLCREDLRREHVLGNLVTDEPEAIWGQGEAIHRRHLAADYPRLCAGCDEWYTYNF